MFVYDGAAGKYAWYCKFPTPVAAADIRAVGSDRWLTAVAGDDSVVSVYETRTPDKAPRLIAGYAFDDELNAVSISEKGRIFAAGGKEIYEITQGGAVRHIEGNFTDVKCFRDELFCAASDGTVSAWKEKVK